MPCVTHTIVQAGTQNTNGLSITNIAHATLTVIYTQSITILVEFQYATLLHD